MDVACNDLVRQRILEEIRNKENELKKNYSNLKKTAIENNHLSSILNDYTEHYKPIRDEKQKQIVILQKITEHLDKLIMNTIRSNDQAALLKNDQKNILEKLTLLKHELEEISPN
jgi:hypothetical protein